MSLDAILRDANQALTSLEAKLREVKQGSDERQKKLLGDLYDLSAYLVEAVTALGKQVNVGPEVDRLRERISTTLSGAQAHRGRRHRRKKSTTTHKTRQGRKGSSTTTYKTTRRGRKKSTTHKTTRRVSSKGGQQSMTTTTTRRTTKSRPRRRRQRQISRSANTRR